MARRQRREIDTQPTPTKPEDSELHFRARLPKQLSGRVSHDTFDKYEALRDTLRTHNGELFQRGAELLIKQLTREDRQDFDLLLQRIRRQRTR